MNRVCAFAQQERGLRLFPVRKRYSFPAPPPCTVAMCDAIGVPRTPHHLLKNLCLPMVQSVMCCWWQGTHYSPSEIRTLKIGRRRTSLGCGTAYQLLPQSPTSEIHRLSWKLLLHAPPGVRRSSTTSPRVWRGCHWGGVASDWYCARYSNPPRNRRPRHTHNGATPPSAKIMTKHNEDIGGLGKNNISG